MVLHFPLAAEQSTAEELKAAIRQLKVRKAAVHILSEFLKALLDVNAIDDNCFVLELMQLLL